MPVPTSLPLSTTSCVLVKPNRFVTSTPVLMVPISVPLLLRTSKAWLDRLPPSAGSPSDEPPISNSGATVASGAIVSKPSPPAANCGSSVKPPMLKASAAPLIPLTSRPVKASPGLSGSAALKLNSELQVDVAGSGVDHRVGDGAASGTSGVAM